MSAVSNAAIVFGCAAAACGVVLLAARGLRWRAARRREDVLFQRSLVLGGEPTPVQLTGLHASDVGGGITVQDIQAREAMAELPAEFPAVDRMKGPVT